MTTTLACDGRTTNPLGNRHNGRFRKGECSNPRRRWASAPSRAFPQQRTERELATAEQRRASDSRLQFTVTITSLAASRPPSCASTRTVYVPGSPKVTFTGNFPSAGTGGGIHPRVQGELPFGRLSWYTLNCSGSNVTLSPEPL